MVNTGAWCILIGLLTVLFHFGIEILASVWCNFVLLSMGNNVIEFLKLVQIILPKNGRSFCKG